MHFRKSEIPTDYIDINTLAELKAYALGGTGVIKIDYTQIHPLTGEIYVHPRITQVKEEE